MVEYTNKTFLYLISLINVLKTLISIFLLINYGIVGDMPCLLIEYQEVEFKKIHNVGTKKKYTMNLKILNTLGNIKETITSNTINMVSVRAISF